VDWIGILEWTTGLEYWNGLLDWNTGMDYWTDMFLDGLIGSH